MEDPEDLEGQDYVEMLKKFNYEMEIFKEEDFDPNPNNLEPFALRDEIKDKIDNLRMDLEKLKKSKISDSEKLDEYEEIKFNIKRYDDIISYISDFIKSNRLKK